MLARLRIQWVLPVQRRPQLLAHTELGASEFFFYKEDFVGEEAVCRSPLSPNMIG